MKTKLFFLVLASVWIAAPRVQACTTFLMKDAKAMQLRRIIITDVK